MRTKSFLAKVLIMLILIISMDIIMLSRVYHNGAGGGYEGIAEGSGNGGGPRDVTTNTIEMYIVEGAGYYLAAASDINSMLNIYEWQDLNGIDLDRLSNLTDSASGNINRAARAYKDLIRAAEHTPYNQAVLVKLAQFDYDLFMQENELNHDIFAKVATYLKDGRITEIFKDSRTQLLEIGEILNGIKSKISAKRVPGVEIMWKLNERCLATSFFGSYVARVFHAII